MLAWTGQVAFQEGPPSPHSCPCGPFVKSSPSLAPWVLTSPPQPRDQQVVLQLLRI